MCDPVTLGLMAFSAISKISEGQQQKGQYEFQAAQAQADANAEREAGVVRAGKVRQSALYQRSQATAALAASGVEAGAGSALVIDQDIVRKSEGDALQEILSGTRASDRSMQRADLARSSADRAESAGYRNAFGSVLMTGSQLKTGWGRTTPAPVEERSIVRIG